MRSIPLTFVFVLMTGALQAKAPDIGPVPPLNFQPAAAERSTLKNGIIVYLMEDHELPTFDLSLKMRTSPGDVPVNLRGEMSLMGTVWRSGGTRTRLPDQLNDDLEFMASGIETSAGEESASISMSCLTKNREKTLEIFKDILLNPAFDESQVTLAKSKTLESIRRKNDDPWSIGRRAFRDIEYGRDHFYAFSPTPESVERIKRDHLVDLHHKIVVPDGSILTVVGDFKKEELLPRLEALFADWKPSGRQTPPTDYAVKNPAPEKIFYVEKDLTQSLIYVGGLGLERHNPDHFAVEVANYVLGEGGSSRLFANVRSRMGLAYMVGSFMTEPKGGGLIGAVCQTKGSTTLTAIQALEKELANLSKDPPSGSELHEAKEAILNSFIFRFNSPSQIVNEQADLEFYGYPGDYLKIYPEKIRLVSPPEISRVAAKYFDLSRLKVLVVGEKKGFERPLTDLGEVKEIPLGSID